MTLKHTFTYCILFVTLLIGQLCAQPFTANLSKLKIHYPKSHTFYVDSVIDGRPNQEILGYIRHKKTRFHSTIFLSEPVSESISKALPEDASNDQEKLLLRINRLFIYETLQDDRMYFNADINVSFIKETDTGFVEQFTAAKMLKFRANHGNKFVTPAIGELLDTCFMQYEIRKLRGKLYSKPLTSLTTDYTAQTNLDLKRGLFYSFYDLRDNFIDDTTSFQFEIKNPRSTEPAITRLNIENSNVSWKDVYAFSDGQDLFIKVGRDFIELTDTANRYWIEFYPGYDESASYAGGMMVSGIAGGIIGVGIYALFATFPKGNDGYYLDFQRGAVVPSAYSISDEMYTETYFYGSSFLADSDTLEISIDQSDPIKIGRDQYLKVQSDYKCKPIEVCILGGETKTCKTVTPVLYNPQIIRCTRRRADQFRIDKIVGSEKAGVVHMIQTGEATAATD